VFFAAAAAAAAAATVRSLVFHFPDLCRSLLRIYRPQAELKNIAFYLEVAHDAPIWIRSVWRFTPRALYSIVCPLFDLRFNEFRIRSGYVMHSIISFPTRLNLRIAVAVYGFQFDFVRSMH
jgi:hypothetical protein